jgi:phospholipid transport system transporter-binding protein
MPSVEPTPPSLERDGDTLRLHGDLVAAGIDALWPLALDQLTGVRSIDVASVGRVDSSGVAFLAELAERTGGADIAGDPPGLAALRAAYRLGPNLGYVA